MKKKAAKKSRRPLSPARRYARIYGLISFIVLVVWACCGVWFVHHPSAWLNETCKKWPAAITDSLFWIGNPVGDFTDSLGLTGSDVVYEYDEPAPNGSITFAGIPTRVRAPAPNDIQVLERDEFIVGWSPSLRHPVWVAYHVPQDPAYEVGSRPNFIKDSSVPSSPAASAYDRSGYDRGHLAPNYAIASRFGPTLQKKTFLMSNIAPQTPALNRGVWCDVELRIANLWTARWGEIWVIVGCISSEDGKRFGKDNIDIPNQFYQLIIAQDGLDVRACALLFDQDVPKRMWPTRAIVTIDELEEATGLDFLPDLPDFIQRPLEASRPSRLWPVRTIDLFSDILRRLTSDY